MGFDDRFTLDFPLGETGEGTIWSASDTQRRRPAAVSVVAEDAPAEATARLAALVAGGVTKVRSTVLARVIDAGHTADGRPYLATDRVEGATSFARRLREGPPLAADQAVRVVVDVLTGLGKLHAAGLVHGDVEPGQVLLLERGRTISPRVVGLGLNRARVREGAAPLEAHAHRWTLGFMAPEQAGGSSPPSADLFSAVAVLYAALSGRTPFRGADAEAIRAAAARRHVPRLGKVCEALDGSALAQVVDRALSRDPAERYRSLAALTSALRGALIRTRSIRELSTAVGPLAADADTSDDALSRERASGPTPEPGRAAAGGAPRVSLPTKRKLKPVTLPPPGQAAPGKAPPGKGPPPLPGALRPPALPQSARSVAPPSVPRPPPLPQRAEAERESLEFERLSGLLEIPPEGSAPRRGRPGAAAASAPAPSDALAARQDEAPEETAARATVAREADAAEARASEASPDTRRADGGAPGSREPEQTEAREVADPETEADADAAEAREAHETEAEADAADAEEPDAEEPRARPEAEEPEAETAETAEAETAEAETAEAGEGREIAADAEEADPSAAAAGVTDEAGASEEVPRGEDADTRGEDDAAAPGGAGATHPARRAQPELDPSKATRPPDEELEFERLSLLEVDGSASDDAATPQSARPRTAPGSGKRRKKRKKERRGPSKPAPSERRAAALDTASDPVPMVVVPAPPVSEPTGSEDATEPAEGGARRGWLPFVALAGAAAVIGLVVWASMDEPEEPTGLTAGTSASASPEPTPEPEPPPPSEPVTEPTPEPPEDAPVQDERAAPVTVTLTGLPEDAEVRVGGEALAEPSVTLDDGPVQVEVRAEGYRPWRATLTPDGPSTMAVSLEPEPPPARPTRATRPRVRPRPRSPRPRSRTRPRTRPRPAGTSPSSGASHPGAIQDPGF